MGRKKKMIRGYVFRQRLTEEMGEGTKRALLCLCLPVIIITITITIIILLL